MRHPKRSGRRLHRLRLQVKKLRYAGELLQAMQPRAPIPALAALRRLQERLGELHDLRLLRKWLRRELPAGPPASAVLSMISRRKRSRIRVLRDEQRLF